MERLDLVVNKDDPKFLELKEQCRKRVLKYIDNERGDSLSVRITRFFSRAYEDEKSISKKKIVTYLLQNIANIGELNVETTKNHLFTLNEIADMANSERFLAIVRFDKANLAKAIEDVKDLIWTYIVNNKPELYQQLKQTKETIIANLTRHANDSSHSYIDDTEYEVLGNKIKVSDTIYSKKVSVALYSEKADNLFKQNQIDAEQKRLNDGINQYRGVRASTPRKNS